MPVWKIPRSFCSVTGVSASTKAVGEPRFQSTLERDLITLLDFDTLVVSYETQPIEISYSDFSGQSRRYKPDIFIVYAAACGRSPVLGEVKYVVDLKRADLRDEHRRRCRAGRDYALTQGWRFALFTERMIRTPLLDNARFLLPYTRLASNSYVEGQLYGGLGRYRLRAGGNTDESAIAQESPSVQELLTRITSSEAAFLAALPVLWQLVGTGKILVDLTQPITMSTHLRLPEPTMDERVVT